MHVCDGMREPHSKVLVAAPRESLLGVSSLRLLGLSNSGSNFKLRDRWPCEPRWCHGHRALLSSGAFLCIKQELIPYSESHRRTPLRHAVYSDNLHAIYMSSWRWTEIPQEVEQCRVKRPPSHTPACTQRAGAIKEHASHTECPHCCAWRLRPSEAARQAPAMDAPALSGSCCCFHL